MTAWRLVRGMSAADGALVIEAAALLLAVRVCLPLIGFDRLRTALQWLRPAALRPRDRVVWAFKAVARRIPSASCLAEALAMDALLRRHGHAFALRIGVRAGDRDGRHGPLDAHAWVECDGLVVIGAVPNLDEYAVLT